MMKPLGPDAALVLGGSFNPPTVAHRSILVDALDATGAGHGVLVPSSDAYVRRKCAKTGNRLLFTEGERLDMLLELASKDPRLSVDACEYGDDGRGHTYATMCKLRERMPGRKLYFLLGADKLRILPKWHDIDRFLSEFGMAVTGRDGMDPMRVIDSIPFLEARKSSFVAIDVLPSAPEASSGRYQELLLRNDPDAASLVTEATYEATRAIMASRRPIPRKGGTLA